MNTKTIKKRPDQITTGDHIWSTMSGQWEPVESAYWSELSQRYVVWFGPMGYGLALYGPSERPWVKTFY